MTEASLETALQRSQQLALKAEALAHLGSWEWRHGDKWPLISPELWRIVGLEPGSQLARPSSILRRIHPEDVERARVALRHSFRRQRPLDLTFRVVRPSGETRHLRAVGEVEAVPGGGCHQIVGTCLDITEVQDARHRLQLQADILRNVRDAVMVTDLSGRISYWNAGAVDIFGYTSDEMLGESRAKLYPDSAMPLVDLKPILDGGELLGEWQGRRRDGSAVWLNVRASAMRDADDRPIGVIRVLTDVTERRAGADRLARLEAAVEQASDSVVIANARAEIEYVNPAFERITGYRRQDVIGKNPRILKSGRQPDSFYEAMWSALTAGQPVGCRLHQSARGRLPV